MKDYKKILEGVVNIINTTEKSDIGFANICAYIGDNCPELKESEDERIKTFIRGLLLPHIVDVHLEGDRLVHNKDIDNYRKALAWLEKQGQTFTKKDIDDAYLKDVCDAKHELEKQGEQKPTDKTEPKFKVGDWVVIDGEELYVKEVTEDGYLTDEGGLIPFRNEKEAHIWSIADAKDGDVLADDVGVILFRKIGNEKYADAVDYHCAVYTREHFMIQKGINFWGYSKEEQLRPATKEQRERFFATIRDAGYEWDAVKLELKKVEQNPVKVPKFKIGDFIQFKGVGHTRYTIKEVCGLSHYINSFDRRMDMSYTDNNFELVEQKPSWSKEDEKNLNEALSYIQDETLRTFIKDRVQPQPKNEWSEEDDNWLINAINVCELNGYNETAEWLKNKLKLLRPQSTWKPSQGQLECLGYAIEKAEKDWSPLINNRIYLTLKALKEQLEKL